MRDLSSIRTLPLLHVDDVEDDLEDELCTDIDVPALVRALRSQHEDEREEALALLAETVDGAFGEDGARLGEEVRASGGVSVLASLLAHPDDAVQQTALCILGNLVSDSVDPHSRKTKGALLPSARSVVSCVYTEDPVLLCFACGALQNLTSEREWADLAVTHDVHIRLEQLVCHEDGRIVRYASGALRNIATALKLSDLSDLAQMAIKERANEHMREGRQKERARETLSRAVARIPAGRRRMRQERGRLRRRRTGLRQDTESDCTMSTWSFEIGPFVRSREASRNVSRPSSACSHASSHSRASSHASYLTAKSVS